MRTTLAMTALTLLLATQAGCSGSNGSSAATAAAIPQECERYFRVLAQCTDDRKSTPEEAEQAYAEYRQGWIDNGAAAASAEQCGQAADMLEGAC